MRRSRIFSTCIAITVGYSLWLDIARIPYATAQTSSFNFGHILSLNYLVASFITMPFGHRSHKQMVDRAEHLDFIYEQQEWAIFRP